MPLRISPQSEQVLRKLREPQRWLDEASRNSQLYLARKLEDDLRNKNPLVPKDTGAGAQGIEVISAANRIAIQAPVHMIIQDRGRRPGAPPPPSSALEGWRRRKGIAVPAFVLARAIGRKGIRAKRFVRHSIQRVIEGAGVKHRAKVAQIFKESFRRA